MFLLILVAYLLLGLFTALFFAKDGVWDDTEKESIVFPNVLIMIFWPVALTIYLGFMLLSLYKIFTR